MDAANIPKIGIHPHTAKVIELRITTPIHSENDAPGSIRAARPPEITACRRTATAQRTNSIRIMMTKRSGLSDIDVIIGKVALSSFKISGMMKARKSTVITDHIAPLKRKSGSACFTPSLQ